MENNKDKNNNFDFNSNDEDILLKREIYFDLDIDHNNGENENIDNINNVDNIENTDKENIEITNQKNKKKFVFIGLIFLLTATLVSFIFITSKSSNKNESNVTLEFTIKENGNERKRTASEMREFYTPEGEEFIKAIYPDSKDSDLALLNIGKSIDNELSDIKFLKANNESVNLQSLKGKRIILDFALTTCPSCQEELSYMSTRETNENEVILHIFPRNTTEDIKNIFKELSIKFNSEHIVSSTGMNGLTFEDFNITHVPTKLFINEDGIITYVTTESILDEELYNLHHERAFGDTVKVLDFLKK